MSLDSHSKSLFDLVLIYKRLSHGSREDLRSIRDALCPKGGGYDLGRFTECYAQDEGFFRNRCRIHDPMAMLEWAKTFKHEVGGWTWSPEDIAQLELAITLDMAGG